MEWSPLHLSGRSFRCGPIGLGQQDRLLAGSWPGAAVRFATARKMGGWLPLDAFTLSVDHSAYHEAMLHNELFSRKALQVRVITVEPP